jgi:hypothetical protein
MLNSKNMNNDKGISLLEVLASLTLLTVVLGVAFLMFGSVNRLFHHTAQNYSDKTELRTTINTISDQMADAVAVRLHSGAELRFRTFDMIDGDGKANAIVYSPIDRSIALYTSSNSSDDLTTGTFTIRHMLAENVEPNVTSSTPAFAVQKYTGGSPDPWSNLSTGITLIDGAMIRITANFALKKIGTNNQQSITYKQIEAVVPLVREKIIAEQ